MYHEMTIVNIVRGDTGLGRDVIKECLAGLGDGKAIGFPRYQMLGGGEVIVTRRGELFEATGQTRA